MFFKTSGIHGLRRMSYPLSQFCYFQALRQVLLLDEIPEKFNGKAILMESIKRIPKPSTFLKISELFQGLKMGTDHCFMRQNIQMLKRGARVRLKPIEKYLHLHYTCSFSFCWCTNISHSFVRVIYSLEPTTHSSV